MPLIWINKVLTFSFIISLLLNLLQYIDRSFLKKEINSLQATGSTINYRIEAKDTLTVGLDNTNRRNHKKKTK